MHLPPLVSTPLVSGLIVCLIGLSLIKTGVANCAGGQAARTNGTFGAPDPFLLACVTLAAILANLLPPASPGPSAATAPEPAETRPQSARI